MPGAGAGKRRSVVSSVLTSAASNTSAAGRASASTSEPQTPATPPAAPVAAPAASAATAAAAAPAPAASPTAVPVAVTPTASPPSHSPSRSAHSSHSPTHHRSTTRHRLIQVSRPPASAPGPSNPSRGRSTASAVAAGRTRHLGSGAASGDQNAAVTPNVRLLPRRLEELTGRKPTVIASKTPGPSMRLHRWPMRKQPLPPSPLATPPCSRATVLTEAASSSSQNKTETHTKQATSPPPAIQPAGSLQARGLVRCPPRSSPSRATPFRSFRAFLRERKQQMNVRTPKSAPPSSSHETLEAPRAPFSAPLDSPRPRVVPPVPRSDATAPLVKACIRMMRRPSQWERPLELKSSQTHSRSHSHSSVVAKSVTSTQSELDKREMDIPVSKISTSTIRPQVTNIPIVMVTRNKEPTSQPPQSTLPTHVSKECQTQTDLEFNILKQGTSTANTKVQETIPLKKSMACQTSKQRPFTRANILGVKRDTRKKIIPKFTVIHKTTSIRKIPPFTRKTPLTPKTPPTPKTPLDQKYPPRAASPARARTPLKYTQGSPGRNSVPVKPRSPLHRSPHRQMAPRSLSRSKSPSVTRSTQTRTSIQPVKSEYSEKEKESRTPAKTVKPLPTEQEVNYSSNEEDDLKISGMPVQLWPPPIEDPIGEEMNGVPREKLSVGRRMVMVPAHRVEQALGLLQRQQRLLQSVLRTTPEGPTPNRGSYDRHRDKWGSPSPKGSKSPSAKRKTSNSTTDVRRKRKRSRKNKKRKAAPAVDVS